MISLGPRNKSMGSSRFKGIIQEAVTMNKTNAPDFKNYFFDWMGDEEQIDDVLVIDLSYECNLQISLYTYIPFTEDYIIAQVYDSNLSSKEERKSDSLYLDSLYNLSYDLSFYDLDSALLVTEEFLSFSRKKNDLNIELV